MRAVADTNILVRAVIMPWGSVGPVLLRLRAGDYTLLYAQPLLEELADVLNRPRIRDKYRLTDDDINTVIGLILLRGEPVTPTEKINACRDPKDDKFLEVAVAGEADVIVRNPCPGLGMPNARNCPTRSEHAPCERKFLSSGDEDLLVLDPFRGISIVQPAAFLRMLGEA